MSRVSTHTKNVPCGEPRAFQQPKEESVKSMCRFRLGTGAVRTYNDKIKSAEELGGNVAGANACIDLLSRHGCRCRPVGSLPYSVTSEKV